MTQQVGSNEITARLITSEIEFDGLEEGWKHIHNDSPGTVFQSFEWLRTWWKYSGEQRSNRTLAIISFHTGNVLVGIAPFFVESISLFPFGTLRQLLFIGRRDSDYLDILVQPGHKEDVLAKLALFLHSNKQMFDQVVCEDVPDDSWIKRRLPDELSRLGWSTDAFITEESPRITFDGDWESYMGTLDGNFRRDLMRRVRNIEKHFDVEFEVIESPTDIQSSFDDLVRLHQFRWEATGDVGVFADPLFERIQRESSVLLARRGWAKLVFLRVNQERVAGNYVFVFKNTFGIYLLGMGDAGEAAKYSPGKVLHVKSIQYALDHGCRWYDFMRGSEPIKYQLAGVNKPNWTLTLWPYPGRRQRVASRKRKFHLLVDSARKRFAKEGLIMKKTVRQHGLLSQETLRFLITRPAIIVAEGRKKMRDPEKPIYID